MIPAIHATAENRLKMRYPRTAARCTNVSRPTCHAARSPDEYNQFIKRNQQHTMKQNESVRTKWFNIRMTEEEYQAVLDLAKQAVCRSPREYARKTLLAKPVILRYRNQSLDDFITEMKSLKKSLDAIGNNFNQSIRRLHTFKHYPDLQEWIVLNEKDKTQLFRQIEAISNAITKAYQLWSRD